ncbi:helix-turn-helix transcriptional regulator [Caviibacter abscessus]|uniref:helix-turn-helix transcriptional regulator n=1 Tax=Caviibacter abscessus TaxID=1766719 RepID=UPI0008326E62|nr:helix-turn-helix domain-containing protein [Caviibacter abscessus]
MYNHIDSTSKYDKTRPITISTQIIEENSTFIHTNCKFIFVLDGVGRIKVNEKEYEIKKNLFINITPWTLVEVYNIEKTINCIILSYNRMYISRTINNINSKDSKIFQEIDQFEALEICRKSSVKITKLLLELRTEIGDENIVEIDDYNVEDNFSCLFVLTKFIEILILISRDLAHNHQKSEFSIGQAIIKYIFAHSSEKLTVVKLATIFFMSESTVRKYIENFSDLTFNELLYKIRLQKTEELLLYTNMNLDEIAKISGFVDGSHITKIWNMKKNMNPSAYRTMYRSSFNTFSEEDRTLAYNIINYVMENYMTEISIEVIAEIFKISEVKINKLLLLYVNRNFSTYLNYVRINKACELLEKTDDSIVDICFKVGYNNIKTFNNNFNKNKNMTPTNFKTMIKNQKKKV